MKDPSLGYARTFVRQVEDCLGLALERGVRIVTNAGGLNPAGLADRLARGRDAASASTRAVAHVEGDDLRARLGLRRARSPPTPTSAAFGIAAALRAGADVVVTGRVTDASLVVGPAIAHFGWDPDGVRRAGRRRRRRARHRVRHPGHRRQLLRLPRRCPRDGQPLGFPLAEIAADGSCVITKHAGTGGAVTVDTVTAQLLYEIQSDALPRPRRHHPPRHDRARAGRRRTGCAVSGVRGEAPPARLKVCVNELGGFRNSVRVRAHRARHRGEGRLGPRAARRRARRPPASVAWTRTDAAAPDADTEEAASCLLRCTVQDPAPDPVGRAFTGRRRRARAGVLPRLHDDRPARAGHAVRRLPRRRTSTAPPSPTPSCTPTARREVVADPRPTSGRHGRRPTRRPPARCGRHPGARPTRLDPAGCRSGTFVHARSGDKGGDANLGLWVGHDGVERYAARVAWLLELVTAERVRELLPGGRRPRRRGLPRCRTSAGSTCVIHGLLGEGVAASTRFDPQAKGLGEWVRSRVVRRSRRTLL